MHLHAAQLNLTINGQLEIGIAEPHTTLENGKGTF